MVGPKKQKRFIDDTNSYEDLQKKKPRKIIDLETKLKVIKQREAGNGVILIAYEFGIPPSTVSNIVKNKEKYTQAMPKSTSLQTSRLLQTQNQEDPISGMEMLLASWITEQDEKRILIKPKMITAKASSLFEMLKKRAGPDYKRDFKANAHWLERFKQTFLSNKAMNPNSSKRCYAVRAAKRINASSLPVNSMNRQNLLSQPNAAKIQRKAGQFQKQRFDNNSRRIFTQPALRDRRGEQLSSRTQVPQHLQLATLPPVPIPTAPPVQVEVVKPKPIEKPPPRKKRIFVVADHQRCIMSNLSSLWKCGKLCDAGIGNGTTTVKVHKLVLLAVCPKLLHLFSADLLSHEFLQLNFPEEVSKEALTAFAEYMYDGILDLDAEILEKLKIIARRLNMREFEQLCDSHLPNHVQQPSAAAFTNVPSIQTNMPVPAMMSSIDLLGSPASNSTECDPFVNIQVLDVKQEITEADLAQIQKDTAAVFGQESAVAPLAANKSGNSAGFVISPSIKTEPVETDDNRYRHLRNSRSSNRVFTSTTSPSSSSTAISTSVPSSSTEFSIPFSQSTDGKSTRLKPTHSYKPTLASDFSPVSRIVETIYSQSSSMKEDFKIIKSAINIK